MHVLTASPSRARHWRTEPVTGSLYWSHGESVGVFDQAMTVHAVLAGRSATGMAAFLSSIGTDWLLKRAFKFLLKRNLGCLLRNEVRGYAGALRRVSCL